MSDPVLGFEDDDFVDPGMRWLSWGFVIGAAALFVLSLFLP